MLRFIDPVLSPDLLAVLREMGHGDEIAIVDCNFPAATMGERVLRADGVSATHLSEAILKLMPLDDFVEETAFVMRQVHAPDELAPVCVEFEGLVKQYSEDRFGVVAVERFAFYEQVRGCFAVVQTAERRLYGNLILKKGVLRPGEG
ncbi:ribose ABC transporter [Acidisoma cellulosilytica]|uniref:Ribose ABC transporter n=1 Tax=Acidisoma cellulosilyticum TaxID=2802395 RepID=A0A964E3L7_9PROT|nr:RbsD/FucU domain-containing protein [Acidisoma cellulosilyticum]MCB8880559.1 ribose ABC transporter [Acidisoma cellulosilyticum]